ncbi:MAG: hypothetical protein E6K56_03505 [Ignavibacteria bacterium]|nr:MAG: hypothetical protein E6K56_03505 [Ignavibacteria bacterium]
MNPKPDKKIPALYGGIIMGLVSSIPFLSLINCLCCAGILLGGFLGVMFYKKNFTPDTPPFTAGDCAAVGALAGVVGAVVGTVLSLLFVALVGDVARQFILDLLKNSNLQLPQGFLQMFEERMREGATGLALVFRLMAALVIDSVFGLLGGLIGYSVFKTKQSPTSGNAGQGGPGPAMPRPS